MSAELFIMYFLDTVKREYYEKLLNAILLHPKHFIFLFLPGFAPSTQPTLMWIFL
jgi:hypothetical protein